MSRKASQNELFVSAVAAGASITEAGRRAGMSRPTAFRRMKDANIVAAIRAERAAMLERASATLTAAATEAAEALRGLLKDESPSVRLSASKSILDAAVRLRSAAELEARIAALESRLEGTN